MRADFVHPMLWFDVQIPNHRVALEAQRAGVDPFEARVIGSTVMGMVDAASREWLTSPNGATFEETLGRGIEYISPLLDQLDQA